MLNPKSQIELGSQPSKFRANRSKGAERLSIIESRRLRHHQYQRQEDTEGDSELQTSTIQPQISQPEKNIWHEIFLRDKAINFAIFLIPCLYLIDCIFSWASITSLPFSSVHQHADLIQEIQSSQSMPLHFLSANLNADPIMDILIVNQNSTCPYGFTALKLGVWPGTVAGCLCENGDLHPTSCEKINSDKCKKDIPATSSREMFIWDHSIWCIKQAVPGTNYLKTIECPTGYVECYSGGCFQRECPITDIKIPSKEEANQKLALTRTKGELPIINIQISFGEIPCFSQEFPSQNIKNSSYQLAVVKENKCDKYGFNRDFSTKLASQTAFNSFAQNYFQAFATNLPGFEENSKTTPAVLSSIKRIKIAKDSYCLNIDPQQATERLGRAFNIHTQSIKMVWSFVLFCLLVHKAQQLYKSYFPHANERNPTDTSGEKMGFFMFCGSSLVFMIGYVITLYGLGQILQSLREDFEGYELLKCFEGSQGSMVIKDSLEIIRKIDGSYWIYEALFISGSSSIVILYRLFYVKKRSPSPNDSSVV